MARKKVKLVLVEWLRTTADAAHEGGGHIGDRWYQGRASERLQMRADDVEILVASGYVKRVAQQVA